MTRKHDSIMTRRFLSVTVKILMAVLAVGFLASCQQGAKNEQHFLKAYQQKADACLAAGMFHSGEYSVGQVKNYLTTNGIKVR